MTAPVPQVRLAADMANERKTLGEVVRQARTEKGVSLRQQAGKLGMSPSYLSDIENDRRVPAEPVLESLAELLDLDFDDLMTVAGRFGESTERYLKSHPLGVKLLRRIARMNLRDEELDRLMQTLQKWDRNKGEGT